MKIFPKSSHIVCAISTYLICAACTDVAQSQNKVSSRASNATILPTASSTKIEDKNDEERNLTAARVRAASVFRKLLDMHELQLGSLGANFDSIQTLKTCLGRADADVKGVSVRSVAGAQKSFLVFLKGERTGTQVVIGNNCDSVVGLTETEFIALSYVAQDAAKAGSRGVSDTILPTSTVRFEATNDVSTISYSTAVGTTMFSNIGTNIITIKIEDKNGKTIYESRYDLASK